MTDHVIDDDRIAEILERLARVEQQLQLSDDDDRPKQTKYLYNSDLCRRYGGKSDMTLRRWRTDPAMNFPKPDIHTRGRPAWAVETIEKWEKARVARASVSRP